MLQVSSSIVKFLKQAHPTLILRSHNIPSKVDWNLVVNRDLKMIYRAKWFVNGWGKYISIMLLTLVQIFFLLQQKSCVFFTLCIIPCVARIHLKAQLLLPYLENQVVLTPSTRVVPTANIDPLMWLTFLKVFDFSFLFFVNQIEQGGFLMICSRMSLMSQSKLL